MHAVRSALELGYRHIDTAQAYGNESSVGRALRESGVARDEVFITTKFHPGRRDPLREAAYSIEQLEVDYVDLYLVHWPGGGATWAWPGMEAARARSYARAIGVSNFDPDELDQVLARATVAPVVDQVHFNPSAYRKALLDACAERDITLEAYSPLGTGAQLGDPVVTGIADRLGRTPAQVLLRWCVQRGIPVITKSTHRDRIAENARDLRLRACRPGHGGTRRPRSVRRDPSGTGAQMVVSTRGGQRSSPGKLIGDRRRTQEMLRNADAITLREDESRRVGRHARDLVFAKTALGACTLGASSQADAGCEQ